MVAVIFSVIAIAGLIVGMRVHQRRRDRASLIGRSVRPDPVPIDRPFDPALCAYCDEAAKYACTACTRPACPDHKIYAPGAFCWTCEGQWERGSRKRALVIAPVVIVVMMLEALAIAGVAMGLGALSGFTSGKLMLGAILVPLALAVPTYLRIEQRWRRRFRRSTDLPAATARSA